MTTTGGTSPAELPYRVLLVDDEPDVRFLLQIQLRLAGFEVVGSAADGAQAIEMCRAAAPDAVVLDLLMPRLNGFEAITLIQAEFPGVGIVAYTGVAGDFVRTEMERLGVEVVLKAGDPVALENALRRSMLRASHQGA